MNKGWQIVNNKMDLPREKDVVLAYTPNNKEICYCIGGLYYLDAGVKGDYFVLNDKRDSFIENIIAYKDFERLF